MDTEFSRALCPKVMTHAFCQNDWTTRAVKNAYDHIDGLEGIVEKWALFESSARRTPNYEVILRRGQGALRLHLEDLSEDDRLHILPAIGALAADAQAFRETERFIMTECSWLRNTARSSSGASIGLIHRPWMRFMYEIAGPSAAEVRLASRLNLECFGVVVMEENASAHVRLHASMDMDHLFRALNALSCMYPKLNLRLTTPTL